MATPLRTYWSTPRSFLTHYFRGSVSRIYCNWVRGYCVRAASSCTNGARIVQELAVVLMPRSRNIKPGFFENEVLAECGPWARLCFAGLWTLADREGRLEDRPKRIKGDLFRFDSIEVEPLLVELQSHGFIERYRNAAGRFIQIVAFAKHQSPHYSERPSVIAPPQHPESTPASVARPPEGSENSGAPTGPLFPELAGDQDDKPPEHSGNTPGVDAASRGGRNPLIPDSGFLIPDSPSLRSGTSSLRSEVAARRNALAPPTPPPFDGSNAEALNGRAVVALAEKWELPEAWGIDSEALGWKPAEVLREAERFRQYWVAGKGKGKRRTVRGWRQSWSNWLARAEKDMPR